MEVLKTIADEQSSDLLIRRAIWLIIEHKFYIVKVEIVRIYGLLMFLKGLNISFYASAELSPGYAYRLTRGRTPSNAPGRPAILGRRGTLEAERPDEV